MARNTFDVLNEKDLSTMLRDHMNRTAVEIADALFNGARPIVDVEREPWALAIALEVVAARAADTKLPSAAFMMIASKTFGFPLVGITHGDLAQGNFSNIGAQLARQAEARAGSGYKNPDAICDQCDRPTLCKVVKQGTRPCDQQADARAHANDARPLDFTNSGVDPKSKVRVVRAQNITDLVMATLAAHPFTKETFDDLNAEQAVSLANTLNEAITALVEGGLH